MTEGIGGRLERERRAELFDRLAAVGKGLASAKRLEIIDLLAQGERTVESAALYASLGRVARDRSADVERAPAAYLGTGHLDDNTQVMREELRQRLEAGEVTLLDVRPVEEFLAGHIPGARFMPFRELADQLDTLGPDDEIVAYCRGARCAMATDATRLLIAQGRRAYRLEDGMLKWRLAGLPVAEGA